MAGQDFTTMVREAVAFFGELRHNNTKDWFEAHRDRYRTAIKAPADAFIAEMADALAAMTGEPVTGKLFRVNRDVRFSKDKSPYNTHLHMAWSPGGDGPVHFFGASPDYVTAGYGVFALAGDGLARYREMIDAEGDALVAAVAAAGATVSDHGPPPLKRVPAPYAADHPHGDLLKRKGFAISADLAPAMAREGADAFALVRDAFARFGPVADICAPWLGGSTR